MQNMIFQSKEDVGLPRGPRNYMHSPYVIALFSQGVRFILHLVSVVVLARLVSPEAFGLVGMGMVVIRFLEIFKTGGLTQAVVRERELSDAQHSAIFWVHAALCLGLTAMAAGLAVPAARFFGEPGVAMVILGLGGALLISGLGLQHRARLQKELRFGLLAVVDILGMATGVAVATAMAWRGRGLSALVCFPLVMGAVETTLLWGLGGWRPGARVWNTGIRPMLRMGRNLSAGMFLSYLSRNLDDLLIGRFVGASALGQYTRAYGLMMLPMSQVNAPVNSVLLPKLSRLVGHPEEYEEVFLRVVRWIGLATTPLSVLGCVWGERLLPWLLGEGWSLAAALFPWLAFAGLFQPLGSLSGTLFVSLGQTGRALKWQVFSTLWMGGAFLLGLPYGLWGLVMAYVVAVRIQQPFLLWYSLRQSPVRLGAYIRALGPGVLLGWVVWLVGIWGQIIWI